MSHVTTIKTEIGDLEALRAAVEEMGAEWRHGQTTYEWFGEHLAYYPQPAGITKEQLGQCDHAIHLPDVNYEIGVVNLGYGRFTLAYDFFGSGAGGSKHDGQKLLEKFGENCGRLVQRYGVVKAEREARRRRLRTRRVHNPNGSIKLQITGV